MAPMINKEKLNQYASAFIMYELASHGVDPRKTLEGTTLRLRDNPSEGYKYDIYEKYHSLIQQGPPYVDTILNALPGGNLVSYYQKKPIEEKLATKGPEELEQALTTLYETDKDDEAFSQIVNAVGGNFDVLGFLFFLKDREKYLPIRSQIFDTRLALLDVNSGLEGHCNWSKYREYLSWIEEIRSFLQSHVNHDFTLIDAHSFLWILSITVEYLNEKKQLVEHKKFGIGTVTGFEGDAILIQFGKEIKKFTKEAAFDKGILRYLHIDPIEAPSESPNDNPPKREQHSYLVIQGLHSKDEFESGFLWAPYLDKGGNPEHSWDRMTEIRKGDLIFHYYDGKIRAVSAASSVCFDSVRPASYDASESAEKGRKLKCSTSPLDTPLVVSDYRDEIVKYKKDKYSAFNKDGSLNQGYVYELEPEIAALFRSEIRKLNTSSKKLKELLSQKETAEENEETYPEELPETPDNPIYEGAKKQIIVNAYERDPKAKQICREYYMKKYGRVTCQICGFDFGKFYGPEYANKIHFHHKKPLYEIKKEYVINPIKDLLPVCPNCHMVLHTNEEIRIEDLKEMIHRNKTD